jgi:polysaccharide export outer membrane protein
MICARLLLLLLLLAAAAGCSRLPPPLTAAAVAPGPAASAAAGAAISVPAVAHASTAESEEPYRLGTGDRLRIVVFGQDGLSNTYIVDSSGAITMPLIKRVAARGLTTEELAHAVADRLRRGFIREPSVAIDVDVYRPFFILGEVLFPGQYAYVPHMTVENAVAIAGGFTPRAYRWNVTLDRPVAGGVVRNTVPPLTLIRAGDTIIVTERWF